MSNAGFKRRKIDWLLENKQLWSPAIINNNAELDRVARAMRRENLFSSNVRQINVYASVRNLVIAASKEIKGV